MNPIKKVIIQNKYLSWLQIFTNWLYQGILNSGKTERIYKISFTLVIWACLSIILVFQSNLSNIFVLILSFIISHTINWLLNCNLHVLLIHNLRWRKISKDKLFSHLESIKQRMPDREWVMYSIVLGSICKGKLNDHSDVDVSIIRKPGFINALKAMLCYVFERKYADFKGIPLDFFICDSPQDGFKRSKNQDNPIVLYDPGNKIDNYFSTRLTIDEAKSINQVQTT